MSLQLTVNGETRICNSDPMTPLVDVLRDELFLTGAKAVCREGMCGACTIHLDGRPVMSCLVPVGTVTGRDIRTIESLAPEEVLSPLQEIMQEHDVVQCGMCFPGMMMTLTSFFQHTPHPNRDEIKAALVGNICRCTGYERLIDAAVALARRN